MVIDVIEKYLPILVKHYPDITSDKIKLFDDGYDHYVLLVDNLHAFRFPRTEALGESDRVENALLIKFAQISPVAIQQITGHFDNESGINYQTYEFIPGIRLSRKMASSLTEQELVNIAIDMGNFLSSLHSFSKEDALKMGIESLVSPQDYGEYFKEFLEKDRESFFSLLSVQEQKWIEQSVKDFYILTKDHPFEMRVTHSDMLPEHIIIDPVTHKMNGIIDFSLRIADPANDFKFFDRYGEIFLKTVYKNYLEVDEYFDKRRKFYAGDLPVTNLYESIERNDSSNIDLLLKQLKEYIAAQLA